MRKEYIKRFLLCALGLACFSVGNVFGVHAGSAGTNAWNTLALGISGTTSLSFGTVTLLISVLVIVIDIIFKGRIGFGTLMNALLISWFSDLLLGIFDFLPYAQNQFIGAALTIIGQTIISFSTILYMWPGLGCGPRDTLMVIIGKRFPKAPIGFIKFCMELVVLRQPSFSLLPASATTIRETLCMKTSSIPYGVSRVMSPDLSHFIFHKKSPHLV